MAEIHALPRHKAASHPIVPKRLDPCDTCTARSLTICASLAEEDQAKIGKSYHDRRRAMAPPRPRRYLDP